MQPLLALMKMTPAHVRNPCSDVNCLHGNKLLSGVLHTTFSENDAPSLGTYLPLTVSNVHGTNDIFCLHAK